MRKPGPAMQHFGAAITFFPPSGEKASTVLAGEDTQRPPRPYMSSLLKNQRDGL